MQLPDYWLPRPAMSVDDLARAAFEQLLAQAKSSGINSLIEYRLTYPKWQFLSYLADHHAIAFHGTGDPDIHVFEPRQSVDLSEFGNRKMVYAAGDGLWAMFYAIIDRHRYPMSLNNACIRLSDSTGQVSEPRYVFSISRTALRQSPWRTGFVYLLPQDTFETQPSLPFGEYQVHIPQLASPDPVTPLARLEIKPSDFPFLGQILGHEDDRMDEYAQAMQTGAPWPD